jgi:hypothetical protein
MPALPLTSVPLPEMSVATPAAVTACDAVSNASIRTPPFTRTRLPMSNASNT